MSCGSECYDTSKCKFQIKNHGIKDMSNIKFDGGDVTELNWSEITVSRILAIPTEKPDIESIDEVYVSAKIDCVNLVETPFASKSYARLATAYEITIATNVINLIAAIDITPIITAANNILLLPLPILPSVQAFQDAVDNLNTVFDALTADLNEATDLITTSTCVLADALKATLQLLYNDVLNLRTALNTLLAALNAMVAAVGGIIPAALITALVSAVNVVLAQITTILTALTTTIGLIKNTRYFSIIPNQEGTTLSGRKLIIDGTIKEKIVYTALVSKQTVHSASYTIPFSANIIVYPKFEGLTYEEDVVVVTDEETCIIGAINGYGYDNETSIVVDLCELFAVNSYIEDSFQCMLDVRNIYNDVVIFLRAKVTGNCN